MILKNGYIIIANKLVKRDILIEKSKIVSIKDSINGEEELDCQGCLIIPGAVDVHVHLRQPGFEHKETIKSGTLAAAKGGVTTVLAMPNLNPCPHNLNNLEVQEEIIKKDALVNVLPFGAVTKDQKGKEISNIEELKDRVVAFTDDGVGVNNIPLLIEVMKKAKQYDFVIASHAEDLQNGKLPEGEFNAVIREIELAKEIGCRYHFCHMSTKESFDAIRKAHQEGYTNITCEVAPHHLFLNETMIKDANWKMNPPLRSEENRLATLNALLDKTAIMIASDHAPHSEKEKSQVYDLCPNGILGLETMIPLVYTNLIETQIASLEDFVNWFVENPSKVFNLPERKVEVGYEATLAILDITNRRKYLKEEIVSLSKNTPYIGMELTGFPRYTLYKGKLVWRN